MDFAAKMCVSEPIAMQIFKEADKDFNERVTPDEWEQGGEDSRLERAVDDVIDANTGGCGEKHHVVDQEKPIFEELDFNGDGFLDETELMKVVMHEYAARYPEATQQDLAHFRLAAREDLL